MKKMLLLLLTIAILASSMSSCGSSDEIVEDNKTIEETSVTTSGENESTILTIDNCPELEAVLFSKEASGEDFAIKYDGAYVEFEACIFKNEKSSITLDRSITVTGEFDAEGEASGWVIKIGNRTWGANIDESVEKGDVVLIKGRVDAEWTVYYNCLYSEADSLSRVN